MRHYVKYTLLFLLVFLALIFVSNFRSLNAVRLVYSEGLAGKNNLQQAVSLAQAGSFSEAISAATLAQDNFTVAYDNVAIIKNNFLVKKSVSLTEQLQEIEYLTNTAKVLSQSLVSGLTIVNNIDGVLNGQTAADFSKFPAADRGKILQMIYEAAPDLNGIKANLNLALMNLQKVNGTGLLKPFIGQINVAKDQLQLGVDLMNRTIILSEILPALAGYPQPSNYLIVLQNSDELRPTGGFIGTVGVFQTSLGDLANFYTNDSYHLDMPASLAKDFKPPTAPAPITKYLKTDRWYLRDSNWSPDWPISAENIKSLYTAEAKYNSDPQIKAVPKFAGVVAITPRLVTDLLYLVGPITVNGQEYNKDNFVNLLQYEVEVGYQQQGVSQWDRKKVVGAIFKELKNKLFTLPSSRYLELLSTLNSEISNKNLLMYFTDPSVQTVAKNLGWGGEIKTAANDFLMVVDANLASFKTDRVMDKNYSYSLEQKADGLYAYLKVTYQHNGQFDWKTTTYHSYVRVYVPLGSQLIKATGLVAGDMAVTSENFSDPAASKTVFGGLISIEPQHNGSLELDYKLPASVAQAAADGRYSLYFQKQPGNYLQAVNIDAKFRKNISSYAPVISGQKVGDQEIKWTGTGDTDQLYETNF